MCSKTKGPNWGEKETRCFLELCIEKQIVKLMDSKKHKHVDIFKCLVEDMQKRGFEKNPEQMKLKLKKLKHEYYKCKQVNSKSGASPTKCPYYEELDVLYSMRPYTEVTDYSQGVDTAIINLPDTSDQENYCSEGIMSETEQTDTSLSNISYEDGAHQTENEETNNSDISTKRRRLNAQERKSYHTILNQYTDMLIERQTTAFTKVLNDQHELFKEVMNEQRQWETEMLRQEHQFQKEQTETILKAFLQCIEKLKPNSSVQPLKIINLTRSPPAEQGNNNKQ